MQSEAGIFQALVERQGMESDRARVVAAKITSADPEILEAAERWAASGVFPDLPVVEGHSPLTLSKELRPSQVFTLLMELRLHPREGLHWLRRERSLSSAGLLRRGADDSKRWKPVRD